MSCSECTPTAFTESLDDAISSLQQPNTPIVRGQPFAALNLDLTFGFVAAIFERFTQTEDMAQHLRTDTCLSPQTCYRHDAGQHYAVFDLDKLLTTWLTSSRPASTQIAKR